MQPNKRGIDFKSEKTLDLVNINLLNKAHRAFLNIKCFESVAENIILINQIIQFLKKEDVKWVVCSMNEPPIIPQNTVWYDNKFNSSIACHIEDFENFYYVNMDKIIKLHMIHIDEDSVNTPNNDGWVTVLDKKKYRKNKIEQIQKEIRKIVGTDWNSISK